MTIQEKNFWLETVAAPRIPARELPQTADVAVIGGGYTGLSAARTLANGGARVAVLEAENVGWGASCRNGGMVLSGLKLGTSTLIARYGREASKRMYAASLESIDCVEALAREENIDCDFSRCGHLEVACKPRHFEEFRRGAETIEREFGHRLRIVEKENLLQEIGSAIYYGGMVDEVSAGVNPAKYVAGLAYAAAKAGAAIHEKTRVLGLERDSRQGEKGWSIKTPRGTLHARDVLIATSGYTSGITPSLHKKIIPIGSFIIVTEALPETLARSENTVRESARILREGMISVYPQLRQAEVEYVWGGTLDFAFDIMPHAGKIDGMFYSVGYAGHGVAMATLLGQKIAQSVLAGRDENPFAGIPFPGAPLGVYNGKPWFLPFAGMWYKFLDWVS